MHIVLSKKAMYQKLSKYSYQKNGYHNKTVKA